jgi:hypothetical protein
MQRQRSNRHYKVIAATLHTLIVAFVVAIAAASALYFLILAFVSLVMFVAFAVEYGRTMSLRESLICFGAVTAGTCFVLYRPSFTFLPSTHTSLRMTTWRERRLRGRGLKLRELRDRA